MKEAEQQPVLIVWEDLQWADPTTLEMLKLLVAQIPTVRIMALLTLRPEPQLDFPWTIHSYITSYTLDRLNRSEVETMVRHVTKGKSLPTPLLEHVVTRTDGIPLCVEELLKMILESDVVREEDDCYMLTGQLLPSAIPTTLQDSLMVRLDRLEPV